MGKQSRMARDELERRRELGGYSDAEFDAEFARSHRSDLPSISIRVVTLVVVFVLLARAIRTHDLPPWLLLAPLAFEFIAIFWIGWILSRFIVPCPTFRKSAGSFALVLVWTVVIVAAAVAAIQFNPGGHSEPRPFADAWRAAWQLVVATELHWAMLAMLAALIGGTVPEVTRWKRERGVFVWASIMNAGFRIGVMFLMGFFGIFVVAMFGEALFERGGLAGRNMAWAVYWFLLIAEVLTLVLSTVMHRETLQKQQATAAKGKRGGALP